MSTIPEPTFHPLPIDVETCVGMLDKSDGAIVQATMAWRRFNPAFTLTCFAELLGVTGTEIHRVKKRLGALLRDMGYEASQEDWPVDGHPSHPRIWRVRPGGPWKAGGVPPFEEGDTLESLVDACPACHRMVVTKDHDCPSKPKPTEPTVSLQPLTILGKEGV